MTEISFSQCGKAARWPIADNLICHYNDGLGKSLIFHLHIALAMSGEDVLARCIELMELQSASDMDMLGLIAVHEVA